LGQNALLAEELDALVARAVHADLRAAPQAPADLEADLRAAVEAERVRQQIAEVPLAERTREAVRDPEAPLPARHAQRRRQRGEIEVGLQGIEPGIGIGLLR